LGGTFKHPTPNVLEEFSNSVIIIGCKAHSFQYYFPEQTYPVYRMTCSKMIKSFEVINNSTGQNNTSPENQYTNINISNCDMRGYLSCWDLGHFAGKQTTLQIGCPGLSNGNKTQADSFSLGFRQE
jgi:hypothetical protein